MTIMCDTFENDLLKLIFNNVALPLVGDASGLQPSAAAGSLYLSLHTADPGEAGNQSTSETPYTSYARLAVARTSGGWTVTGSQATNAAVQTFAAVTAVNGSGSITYIAVGTAASGTGKIIGRMALVTAIPIAVNVTPQFPIGNIAISAD